MVEITRDVLCGGIEQDGRDRTYDQAAQMRKNSLRLLASLLTLLHVLRQPLQAFEQTLARRCAAAKDLTQRKERIVNTHLGWTYHDRSRIRCRPSFSVTSAGDIAAQSQPTDSFR